MVRTKQKYTKIVSLFCIKLKNPIGIKRIQHPRPAEQAI